MRAKPFDASQFVATEWNSAADKAAFGNTYLHFIESDWKQSLFTKSFYQRLSNCFGHIAHYTVSETNCIRQPFSFSDLGLNKATVLVNRINLFWGTEWKAFPVHLDKRARINDVHPDVVIGCVDTRAARRAIEEALKTSLNRTSYWLDLGNNAASGQYVLGQPLNARNHRKAERLRTVSELYPEIVDAKAGEDPLPSCSAIEALDRQEPFINQTLATSALAMLARLFRHGKLKHHGAFFNAATGHMSAIPVDPDLWRRTRRRSLKDARNSNKH